MRYNKHVPVGDVYADEKSVRQRILGVKTTDTIYENVTIIRNISLM
jgi:hypothetical protein